jgi:glycosyltransferase involved in cell wall biosynthesis
LYQRIIDLSITNLKKSFLDIKYIAVTKFESEYLRKFGIHKENIYLIPHGIDVNHFKHTNSSKFIKIYNLEKKKIVLFVGRLFKDKRIDILIRAFSLLKKEVPNAVLILAGGDFGYKSTVENLIQKLKLRQDVLILGHVSKMFLPELYSIAKIVVMPAKSETFGLVALEANACKTPVIASNHWGPREIIINGKNGFLIEFGNIIEMKEKLYLIMNDEKIQKKMGEFAREHVINNFSWEINAKKHFELYKKILET